MRLVFEMSDVVRRKLGCASARKVQKSYSSRPNFGLSALQNDGSLWLNQEQLCSRLAIGLALPFDMDDFAELSEVAANVAGVDAVFHVDAIDKGREGQTLAFSGRQISGDGFTGA
jgi:hypothetical protein